MPLEVAAHAGFCMGVRRAVEAAMQVAGTDVPSCTLGALIHNPTVVHMLAEHGVPAISSPDEADGRQVLIRSHGVSPDVIEQLRERGCSVLDLTCPFVDRLHRIVAQARKFIYTRARARKTYYNYRGSVVFIAFKIMSFARTVYKHFVFL